MNGFGLDNLPFGVFRRGNEHPRCGVRFEDSIFDLGAAESSGLLDSRVFGGDALNDFFGLGRDAWRATRERVAALIERGDGMLVALSDADLLLPFRPGDYVDFYSSIQHATNLGRLFRPDGDPLLPNWRSLPVGYHGRSATVVVSGTPVVRPCGQRKPPGAEAPVFGPSARLDFELEIGFVTGPANALGEPIPAGRAEEHIFGVVLVNDWSARDVQAWEYQPLGPFLGKSFATSISPWVVPLDALRPFMRPAPAQDPPPLDYLRRDEDWVLDLSLEVVLAPKGDEPATIARTNASNLYWTMSQQLAHATCNGAVANPGDLFASGTISGDEPGSYGSMIELSWNGERPVEIAGGARRAFLEDGDTVTIRGMCEADGHSPVSFGEVAGTVLPAS